MGKRDNKFWIIGIIIVVFILIAAFILSVVVINMSGGFKSFLKKDEVQPQTEEKVKAYLRAYDDDLKNFTDAHYILEYENIVVSEGELDKDSWLPLEIAPNKTYHLYCWSDEYYNVMGVFAIGFNEENHMQCYVKPIGDITISADGNLSGSKQKKININISSTANLRKMHVCWGWSVGILDATLPDQTIYCNGDHWINWTKYHAENDTYEYLPKGQYQCRPEENRVEDCRITDGPVCYLENEVNPPSRFSFLVDRCVYTGTSLAYNSYNLEVTVKKTELFNDFDYLRFIVYDADRRKVNDQWLFVTELDGQDVAATDHIYELKARP